MARFSWHWSEGTRLSDLVATAQQPVTTRAAEPVVGAGFSDPRLPLVLPDNVLGSFVIDGDGSLYATLRSGEVITFEEGV
jgi:hypothetical protein